MDNDISSHEFTPTLGDPGTCGVGSCGEPWSHAIHNPADNPKWGGTAKSYFRLTSSAQKANDLNEAVIDAADLKKVVSEVIEEKIAELPSWVDNPNEVTPPHAFVMKSAAVLSVQYAENADFCDNCDCLYTTPEFHPDSRAIRCPVSTSCSNYAFDRPSHYVTHAVECHDLTQDQAVDYLQNPWYVGETRAEWQGRIPDLQWWRKYQAGPDAIVKVEVNPDPTAMAEALQAATAQFRAAFGQAVAEEAEVAAGDPDFRDWWVEWVDNAAPTIQRKAAEYGSNSLAEMGRTFARAQGRHQLEDHESLEIGCMFYAKGKIERVLDAMLQGKLPSADTWGDLMIYAAMASYIREFRRWP